MYMFKNNEAIINHHTNRVEGFNFMTSYVKQAIEWSSAWRYKDRESIESLLVETLPSAMCRGADIGVRTAPIKMSREYFILYLYIYEYII